jgi:hypothetical protein
MTGFQRLILMPEKRQPAAVGLDDLINLFHKSYGLRNVVAVRAA